MPPRRDIGVVLPDGVQQLQGVLLDTVFHGILLTAHTFPAMLTNETIVASIPYQAHPPKEG